MTIKRSLFLVILFLNVLVAYFLVSDIIKTWEHKHHLAEEQEANIAMTDLIKSASSWAVERGVTNAALSADGPVSEARKEVISENRGTANEYYEDALKHIVLLNEEMDKDNPLYNHVIEHTEQMKKDYAAVEVLRAEIDKALTVPKSQRNAELTKTWVPTMSKLIITSQDLRYIMTEEALKVDPELGLSLIHI